jgi:hypothetical protein
MVYEPEHAAFGSIIDATPLSVKQANYFVWQAGI